MARPFPLLFASLLASSWLRNASASFCGANISGAEGRGPRSRATLAIGVMSAPGDSSRRGYIRPSLHRACASDTGLAFRFVLGLRGVSRTMVASTVAENETFGDLLGLSAARDGGRQYFAEKTLAWLRYAGRAFPLADFIGKVDQDTYFVWNRARHLLDLALWQAGDRALYVGQMGWTSFLPEERRVCGCCGYTREHGAYLQSQTGARFGSCGPQKSANTVAGPFPFAQGAFYALSRAALETGILRSSEADETHAVLASDRLRNGDAEDIIVGFLLSRSVPALLILHWGLTIFHNFDEGGLPRKYHQIERACLDRHAVLSSQLTTGELSRWGTTETIGPMSAVVHRVVDAQQWARADVLVAQWSRMLQHRGHPDCFYPNGTVTLAAGSKGSRRLGQHRRRGTPSRDAPATLAKLVRPGFCAKTVAGPSDCAEGDSGTWTLQGASSSFAARCIQKCFECPRCKFVSFSADYNDCSWFRSCNLGSLSHLGDRQRRRGSCHFGSDFFSLRVGRKALEAATTSWTRLSSRCERARRPYTPASVLASALRWDGHSEAHAVRLKEMEMIAARACTQSHSGGILASGGFCLGGLRTHQVTSHFGSASYTVPEVHWGAEPAIVTFLASRLPSGASLNDFGAGVGIYGLELRQLRPNVTYRGYDGAGDSWQATRGFVSFADLTFENLSLPRADWVLSLEVGEHVPLDKEAAYVRNLHAHNCRGLLLSWGIVGQPGFHHVNTHRAAYIRGMFEELGYVFNKVQSRQLRKEALLPWFKASIYVFERPVAVC